MHDPKPRTLQLFTDIHEATSVIQLEMSTVIITHAEARKRLEAQLKLPDAVQMETLQNAVHQFISYQPLAQMNGINLISMVLACHSNLTGEPDLHEFFDAINRKVMDMPEDGNEPD